MAIPNLGEFRNLLVNKEALEIVQSVVLANEAKHLKSASIDHVANILRARYGLQPGENLEVHLVGSAKLGFSIVEKRKNENHGFLPRYRDFGPSSDYDFAIVSQSLFYKVWCELSSYSHQQRPFPWESTLAHFMVVGWLRPDHFPKAPRPTKCQLWWEIFGSLSSESAFGGRRVRGALYFTKQFLEQYQCRAILECQQMERAI
jgi:hypothetical protein